MHLFRKHRTTFIQAALCRTKLHLQAQPPRARGCTHMHAHSLTHSLSLSLMHAHSQQGRRVEPKLNSFPVPLCPSIPRGSLQRAGAVLVRQPQPQRWGFMASARLTTTGASSEELIQISALVPQTLHHHHLCNSYKPVCNEPSGAELAAHNE